MRNSSSLYKYKSIILPLVFMVSAVFIVFQVLAPSIQGLGSTFRDFSSEEKKLSNYNNSLKTLQSLDSSTLDNNIKLVSAALPSSKDLQSIYLAVTDAALRSKVNLKGFTVKVGDVFQKDKKTTKSVFFSNGIPTVTVNAQFTGTDPNTLKNFMKELSLKLPLSKIMTVDLTNGEGSMDISFYYKPFDLNTLNDNVVLPLDVSETDLLKKLPQ